MTTDSLTPELSAKVRTSFAAQGLMRLLDARIVALAPGRCEIELPYSEHVTQQHGYFHGGAIGMLADDAGGYASYTLIGLDDASLTVEYKINLLAPGVGDKLVARGRVLRAGRQLIVAAADVFAVKGREEKLIAVMQQTLFRMAGMEPARAGDPPGDSGRR